MTSAAVGPEIGADDTPGRTRLRRSLLILVLIWAGWAIALLAFQEIVVARVAPARPDAVLEWTASETGLQRANGRPYLGVDTLATHIAFDSEYYLSIAAVGYDDPLVPQYSGPDGDVPLNYAFLPGYPFAMKVVAAPLTWFGIAPAPAAAVAGVAVSLGATLVAMLALFRLARPHLADAGGIRTAFYLLIFPTGFFLAQVYSEAFFLAASFGALAAMVERRPFIAAAFSVVAVLTRPVGVALVPAAAVALLLLLRQRREAEREISRTELIGWVVALLAPLVTYLAWSASEMGRTFDVVQREYFGRGMLDLEASWTVWTTTLAGLGEALPETRVYYGLEVAAVVLAVIASVWAFRRWPAAAVFGLATLVIAMTSGVPQGMVRYVLAVPVVFLLLARLGGHPAFDRVWTVVSLMLMALLAALYSVDFWVA
ncbi:MAG TPA: mannosyltransferase family protein [Candidatus Limnocylindria bacterium]